MDETYKCPRCHNEFPKSNKTLHDLRCTASNPMQNDNYQNSYQNNNMRNNRYRNNNNFPFNNQQNIHTFNNFNNNNINNSNNNNSSFSFGNNFMNNNNNRNNNIVSTDERSFPNPDGTIEKIKIDTFQNGIQRVTRTKYDRNNNIILTQTYNQDNNNNFNNNNFNNNNFNNNNFNNSFYGNNNNNYVNNNNGAFINNNNANSMMMDNIQMTMINFMNNFMKAYESANNSNNFSQMQFERETEVQNPGVVGGLLPRIKTTENYDPFNDVDAPKYNVFFQTPVGYKVNMIVPYNAKLEDILIKYVKKVGVGPNTIDKDIYFLFGGNKIKKDDKRTAQDIGLISGSIVIALDKKGIIGA